jgi:hypothetical protein
MPRSFTNGDYTLLLAVESASRPQSWYRVLADRRSGAVSCDCPPFIFNRQHDAQGHRRCQHTDIAVLLSTATRETGASNRVCSSHTTVDPLLVATQEQWPGLRGIWSIERRTARIQQNPYLFVLVRLEPGNGGEATGVVAFAERHQPSLERLQAGVAGWAGYAIAAEVARRGGYPLAGQPPEHFRVPHRNAPRHGAAPSSQAAFPSVGLADILRVGDTADLGDGLRPAERAERTLRLFLGETLYAQLETQHFLDVSSVRFAERQRVYRLRRDPMKVRERRVRVFEYGQYVNDFCIVRGQDVPEADHFLTVFLQLLSDEQSALSVVRSQNVFRPLSDGREAEFVPAVWHPGDIL